MSTVYSALLVPFVVLFLFYNARELIPINTVITLISCYIGKPYAYGSRKDTKSRESITTLTNYIDYFHGIYTVFFFVFVNIYVRLFKGYSFI